MIFEWDEQKNQININKHGISFKLASRVFLDENVLILPDEVHSLSEERSIAVGQVGRILYVVFTERRDRIRIISARRATRLEEQLYDDNLYSEQGF